MAEPPRRKTAVLVWTQLLAGVATLITAATAFIRAWKGI
jgi:hypothetical protein